MKNVFVSVFLCLFTALPVVAADITMIRIGAVGANSDRYASVMGNNLSAKGWKVRNEAFLDCKGAEKWIKANPKTPVLYFTWADDFVLPFIQPDHPRACPGLTVNVDTLVTPIVKSYHMFCSKKESSLKDFLSSENAKIGSWNHPVQLRIVDDLIKDFQLKNAKLINFARGSDLLQALVAGDIDYMVVSSENLVRNMGGQCFLTTAPKEHASKMSDFKTNQFQTSVDSVVQSPSWRGTGLIPVYVAYNVDMKKLRSDVVDIISNNPEFANIWSTSTVKSGIMAGLTPEQQWKEFDQFMNKMRGQQN